MNKLLIKTLRGIYKNTPSQYLRGLYFDGFCRIVRNRRTRTAIDGITFDLDLGEIIDLSIYLQQFEPEVTTAIEHYCREGDVIFDIGANIGAHTLRFSKIAGKTGKVFAFEPTNFAYNKLLHNISLNHFGQISATQIALSDSNIKEQKINFRSSWRTDGKLKNEPSFVDFVKLDDWCSSNLVEHVDIIKIDVDGNEFPIIKGAITILKKCRPLMLMEVVSPHFKDDAENPFLILKKLNYRFWDAKSGKEYSIDTMKSILPADDFEMTKSFNVIVATEHPNKI